MRQPVQCSICNHAQRRAIEEARAEGGKLVDVAAKFGISKSALGRHENSHASRPVVARVHAPNERLKPPMADPAPYVVTRADTERQIKLPNELLEAMRPLTPAEADDPMMLERKLSHINAVNAYGLSRAVAKDDVPSILRAAGQLQKLYLLDVATALERARVQQAAQVEPIHRMLASIIGTDAIPDILEDDVAEEELSIEHQPVKVPTIRRRTSRIAPSPIARPTIRQRPRRA